MQNYYENSLQNIDKFDQKLLSHFFNKLLHLTEVILDICELSPSN